MGIVEEGAANNAVRLYDPERRQLLLSEVLAPRSRHFQLAVQIGQIQYSIACNEALAGRVDKAFAALEACVKHVDRKWFKKSVIRDGDLRSVRADKRFKAWFKAQLERDAKKAADAPAEKSGA